jgi:hypothetical protein
MGTIHPYVAYGMTVCMHSNMQHNAKKIFCTHLHPQLTIYNYHQ